MLLLISLKGASQGSRTNEAIELFVLLNFGIFSPSLAIANEIEIRNSFVNSHLFILSYGRWDVCNQLLVVAASYKKDTLPILRYAIIRR